VSSQAIFIYLFKAILIAGIFFGYYLVVLKNKRFHYYNRFYLLCSLVLSMVIPLLNFSWITISKTVNPQAGRLLNYIVYSKNISAGPSRDWTGWLLSGYACIVIGLLLALVVNILKIYRLKRSSVITRMDGFDFIATEDDLAPFSYSKNLFWKTSIPLETEEGKRIFRHELTHIRQRHTADCLFSQLSCIVFWLNPFFWFIQKELLTIHEFIADEHAIDNGDTESFARMLLKAHYGNYFLQPGQSFFYSSIKRRLIMLSTSTKTRYSYARRLIALPLLACTIAVFSLQVKADAQSLPEPATTSISKQEHVQEEAKFPGGREGWQKFLSTTCNFKSIVEKGGAPGKYTVLLSFIIDKEGKIKDVQALNDPGFGSREDAVRVLSASPKWTPAKLNGKNVIYRNKVSITYVVPKN
jgi:hypothetical protein